MLPRVLVIPPSRSRRGLAFGICLLVGLAPLGCSLLADWDGLAEGPSGDDAGPSPDAKTDTTPSGDAGDAGDGDAAPILSIAEDDFERTVASGFGAAPRGGPWRVIPPGGTDAGFSVDGHFAVVELTETSAVGPYLALLEDVKRDDVEVALTLSPDRIPSGGTATFGVYTRLHPEDNYVCNVQVRSNGDVMLGLSAQVANVSRGLASGGPFFVATAGMKLRVRFQAFGLDPTTLRAKVWAEGTPEPSSWLVTSSDASPVLQSQGVVGFSAYVAPTVTNLPFTVRADDLLVRQASLLPN